MSDDGSSQEPSVRREVHDIRAELTAIRGHAELLRRDRGQFTGEDRSSFLDAIDLAAEEIDRRLKTVSMLAQAAPAKPVPDETAILEAIEQPIVAIDRVFRVIGLNSAFVRLFAQQTSEVIAVGDAYLEHLQGQPGVAERSAGLWRRALSGEVVRLTVDMPLPGAGTTPIAIAYQPLRDADEQVLGAVAVYRDLADVESESLPDWPTEVTKSWFLARMSHELRTPLNAVIGFGQVLDEALEGGAAEADNAVVRGYARDIVTAGRDLLRMVDDLLDIAQLDAGRLNVSVEPVAFASVLRDALSVLAPLTERFETEIAVHADVPDDLHVSADATRLRQVLLILLDNAVRHGGSHVTVVARQDDAERVLIVVEDDGPGIPAALAEHAFETFARLRSGWTGGGAGLGLALAAGLCEAMGAPLTLTGYAPAGARFEFRPRVVDAPRGLVARDAPARVARTGTILYIEDNLSNVRLVESVMRLRPGVRLRTATHGRRGAEMARSSPPDLVLLDLHLPDLHGISLIGELRAASRTEVETPVVVVSADASRASRVAASEAGAQGYLTKPFEIEELLELVDEHLP